MPRGVYRSPFRVTAEPAPQVADVRARVARRGSTVLAAALGLGLVYLIVTDEAVDTKWFLAAIALALPLAGSVLMPWERMARTRSGGALLLVRYGLLSIVVSMAVASTGGPASQLWVLYALIGLFVGWCFDGLTEFVFAAASAGVYVGTVSLSGGIPSGGVLFARIGCLGLVAAGVSLLARESREKAETALVAAREAAALAEARRGVASQAQYLNGLQSEFVSTVSHELRTPLTAIIGNLATLQRGATSDPAIQNMLMASTARHARRLNSLIEDLLVASRINDGALQVRLEEVDGLEVVNDVIGQVKVARPEARLSVIAAEQALLVLTDRDHLHRVILNLADNAVKYGGGAPVRVRVTRVGRRVRFVVEDDGPGIDPADHARIFERFAQVDGGERRAVGGTGLGLHICARLVDNLGGHLAVASLPGSGTAFGFTLSVVDMVARAPSSPLSRSA